MENYSVQYFVDKFEAIPEEKWHCGDYHKNGKFCAYGHCGMHNGENKENKSLEKVFRLAKDMNIIAINDGEDHRYKQHHPKQRILAALYDIKLMQEPLVQESDATMLTEAVKLETKRKNITKSLATLPPEETSDLILTTCIKNAEHSNI